MSRLNGHIPPPSDFPGAILLDSVPVPDSAREIFGDVDHTKAPTAAPIAAPTAAADTAPKPKRVSARRQRRADRVVAMRAAGVEPLGFGGRMAAIGIVIGAVAIGVIGFAASFANVTEQMRPHFGQWAPLVPAGIDLGIAVTISLDILLARMRMRPAWLRLVPWSLTAITIWLNAAGYSGIGLIGHIALPAMFIVMAEIAAHVIRVRAGLAAGEVREGVRLPRWLVAPVETARLWAIMARTPGVDTYAHALEVRADSVMADAALRTRFGVAWRLTAPLELRARRRLRLLTADDVHAWVSSAPSKPTTKTPAKPAATSEATTTPKASTKTTSKPAAASKPRKNDEEKLSDDAALEVIRALPRDAEGFVAVKAVRRATNTGFDRAKRLLAAEGLLAPAKGETT